MTTTHRRDSDDSSASAHTRYNVTTTTTAATAPVPAHDPAVQPPSAPWYDVDDPSAARTLRPDHHHRLDDDNGPSLSTHARCDATTTTTGMTMVPAPACMHAVTRPTTTTTGDAPSASMHARTLRCGRRSGQLAQGQTTTTIRTAGRMDGDGDDDDPGQLAQGRMATVMTMILGNWHRDGW